MRDEKRKLVSVIVPIFNTKDYLRSCMDSILSQDHPNIEVILVDDGSSDGSESIIREYVDKYENVMAYGQENKGVGAARNLGVSKSTGDYVTFVDSDDTIFPNYCSYLLEIIGDADIVVAGRENSLNGKYIKSKTAANIVSIDSLEAVKYLLLGKYSTRPAWGKLYKKELADQVSFVEGHIFEELRYAIDTLVKAKKVVYADKDLYSYRIREGSIMSTNMELQIIDMTLAMEYTYRTLINENLYSYCEKEFRIWLTNVIARNSILFCNYDINTEVYRQYTKRATDLFEELGEMETLFH